jgi:hypothetical protein
LGTNSTQIATTAFVIANGGMGVSAQAWTDVTASRAFTTTYTNSTGRGIMVSVLLSPGASNLFQAVTVGGTQIALIPNLNAGAPTPFSFIVQSGATYSIAGGTGSPSISSWVELR